MEQLVDYIFAPSPEPALLQQAQNELRSAQKSENGWELALQFLNSANPNAQFIGAQTFLVQLSQNKDIRGLDQIKRDLLVVLESCVSRDVLPFVLRKLLGVITKVFLETQWPDAPLRVLQILESSNSSPAICFEFLNYLIEDSALPAVKLREKLVPDVCQLVKDLVEHTGLADENSARCLEIWAAAFFDEFREEMSQIVTVMLAQFHQGNEESTAALLSCVNTLFAHHWRAWKPSSITALDAALVEISNCFTQSEYVGESELGISLTRLVIAVCEEDFEQHTQLHPFLASVAATNTRVVDDPLASEVLEFWNQYAEEIISGGMSASSQNSNSSTHMMIVNVISGYWPRIKLYNELKASEWDEMSSFRKDFADFLELSYPILGLQLFEHLTLVVLDSMQMGDWMAIESALFCLNGLADIIGTDYEGETPEFSSVQRIFQSPLWEQLPQCDHLRVKQTAVNTIGCFVDFFLSLQGQPYLAVTLNYLFSTLHTPFLQNTASRSIQKLCDTCRLQLTNEIPAFLAVYKQIRPILTSVPHIRTVAAVACVIQAVSDLSFRLQYISELFSLVANMPQGPESNVPLEEFEQTRLKCLATLGKHLNAPASEGPSSGSISNTSNAVSDVEIQAFLRPQLQEVIAVAAPSVDIGIIEAICDIIKVCLFDEVYTLSEEFIISFIINKACSSSEDLVPPIMDLAKVFVATRLANSKRNCQPQLSMEAMQKLVDLAVLCGQNAMSSTLDMLTQIVLTLGVSGWTHQHNQPQPDFILKVLELSINGIGSTDRFVLRSAVAFWKEYLAILPLTEEVGTPLVQTLLVQASGNASRSEIPPISEVFKALMAKQPLVGSQLLKKLVVDHPVGRNLPKQDEKSRRDFVAQLVLVRGGRKTSDIVQQFWLMCRNIPASYDPKT